MSDARGVGWYKASCVSIIGKHQQVHVKYIVVDIRRVGKTSGVNNYTILMEIILVKFANKDLYISVANIYFEIQQ